MRTLRWLIKPQEADFGGNNLKPFGNSKHHSDPLVVTISFHKQWLTMLRVCLKTLYYQILLNIIFNQSFRDLSRQKKWVVFFGNPKKIKDIQIILNFFAKVLYWLAYCFVFFWATLISKRKMVLFFLEVLFSYDIAESSLI